MSIFKKSLWPFGVALLCVAFLPCVVHSEQLENSSSQEQSSDAPLGRKIGAPQVLEIPLPSAPEEVPAPAALSSLPSATATEPPAQQTEALPPVYSTGQERPGAGDWQQNMPGRRVTEKRNYLGVLYATTEEEPAGVKVLDIVPGSPAERAGFHGANNPPEEGQSKLIKAAIVVLAMSPAGPFAIPLAIAHDMYMNRQSPGDVIVSVDNQSVSNAQEFTNIMRRYKPRDTVMFSILRGGKPMQISVQLEEEPA
ncbi:MAG: PDZ domain-containing protein [Candidatus Binatia bacterium]